VDGIVAQKHKQRSKAVVLSDSPNGVEWGMGNLIGSIEQGLLVWRNRAGKVMYEWQPDGLDSQPAQEPKSNAVPQRKGKDASVPETVAQLSSPRSTSSTASTAPTETAPPLHSAANTAYQGYNTARIAGDLSSMKQMLKTTKVKQQTKQEVAKLLEMAGSRLASGDYGTAMQYVLFAQTLHPAEAVN
jgi:hypothetical protein